MLLCRTCGALLRQKTPCFNSALFVPCSGEVSDFESTASWSVPLGSKRASSDYKVDQTALQDLWRVSASENSVLQFSGVDAVQCWSLYFALQTPASCSYAMFMSYFLIICNDRCFYFFIFTWIVIFFHDFAALFVPSINEVSTATLHSTIFFE